MRKIKVLISDFQFLTREGLIHMVNEKDQFELSGVVEGADEVMKSVLQEHPDVLLMDYEGNDPVLKSLLNHDGSCM